MGEEGQNRNGINELMLAASRGELARVESLVASGADIDAKDAFGFTALMYATSAGHISVVESLLAAGANAHLKNRNGLSASDLARSKGHTEVAQTLRHACLFIAARDGDLALLNETLDSGADINARFADGWTALMVATRNEHAEAVSVLLRRGAERVAENHMGWTALLMAERKGHEVIARMLRQGLHESTLSRLTAPEPETLAPDLTSFDEPLDPDSPAS